MTKPLVELLAEEIGRVRLGVFSYKDLAQQLIDKFNLVQLDENQTLPEIADEDRDRANWGLWDDDQWYYRGQNSLVEANFRKIK